MTHDTTNIPVFGLYTGQIAVHRVRGLPLFPTSGVTPDTYCSNYCN